MTETAPTPKATLHKNTSLLFHIAARSHTLAEMFGIERDREFPEERIKFHSIDRPWLVPHFKHQGDVLAFDPDKFAKRYLGRCSDGQEHMVRFILNVWNPSYAQSKGWTFDLFKAMNTLDQGNRQAIAWWLEHPLWP